MIVTFSVALPVFVDWFVLHRAQLSGTRHLTAAGATRAGPLTLGLVTLRFLHRVLNATPRQVSEIEALCNGIFFIVNGISFTLIRLGECWYEILAWNDLTGYHVSNLIHHWLLLFIEVQAKLLHLWLFLITFGRWFWYTVVMLAWSLHLVGREILHLS